MLYGLTKPEVGLLCDVFHPESGKQLWRDSKSVSREFIQAELEDAIRRRHLDQKWQLNRNTMMDKITALDRKQANKLMEAVQYYWQHYDEGTRSKPFEAPARYLMNSAVIPAYGRYNYSESSWAALADFIRESDPVSRVGYPDTCKVIEQQTGYHPVWSRGSNSLEPGERAMVVRLRYRLASPGSKFQQRAMTVEDYEVGLLERLQ